MQEDRFVGVMKTTTGDGNAVYCSVVCTRLVREHKMFDIQSDWDGKPLEFSTYVPGPGWFEVDVAITDGAFIGLFRPAFEQHIPVTLRCRHLREQQSFECEGYLTARDPETDVLTIKGYEFVKWKDKA